MIKILVYGAAGKMGKSNVLSITKTEGVELVSAVEVPNAPYVGEDIGVLCGCGLLNIKISDNFENELQKADVVIDFTSPKATLNALEINKKYNKAFVIGTTGLTDEDKSKLREYSKSVPIVFASNYSIGVNLLFRLTELAGNILNKDRDYDLEIVESHHRFKKDSPSGTALSLCEIAAKSTGRNFKKDVVYGREGIIGERNIDQIGLFAVRGGDIIGEHQIIFTTLGERIELAHKAHSRETFSKGAVTAAKWIIDKKNGLYNMQDVLGFN